MSRARFEEAYEIIVNALDRGGVLSYAGKFWSLPRRGMWPRPVQQPLPAGVDADRRQPRISIEWAARNNIPITPGPGSRGLQEDIIRLYAGCLERAGHRTHARPSISIAVNAYVADSKAQAVRECGPYLLYFNRTLFSHGNLTETDIQRTTGYVQAGRAGLHPAGEPAVRRTGSCGLSQHDDGGYRAAGRDTCRWARRTRWRSASSPMADSGGGGVRAAEF